MSLLAFFRELKTLEESIGITDPITITKPKVYLLVPNRADVSTEKVIFENVPVISEEARMADFREDTQTVRVRCTTYDADYARACEIALAYFDKTWQVFDSERPAGRRFGSTCDYLTLRTERDMLQNYEGRPGFEIFLDLTIFNTSVVVV